MGIFKVLLLSIAVLTGPLVSSDSGAGKVEITITGFKNEKGQVVIKIYNGPDGFPREDSKAIKTISLEINNLQCTTSIDLPGGEYAIAVNHDENKNGEVDTNFIGIPNEPLGMSNYEKMSKPNYDKAKFKVQTGRIINLNIPLFKIF